MRVTVKILLFSLMLLMVVAISSMFPTPSKSASYTRVAELAPVYIPTVMNDPGQIWGYVTDNGVPAVNTPIELYTNTLSFFPIITYTDSAGRYHFSSVPTLTDITYYVMYRNWDLATVPGHLSSFKTSIQQYTAGTMLQVETFDIADIVLLDPIIRNEITLPYTFLWQPRPANSDDNYVWWSDCFPLKYVINMQSPPLGYAGSFTLYSVASDALEIDCSWGVNFNTAEGGIGYSSVTPSIYYQPSTVDQHARMKSSLNLSLLPAYR